MHVTCEHVKHDYAPVYTIDVALPKHICTEQMKDIDLFVLASVQYINFLCLGSLLSVTYRISRCDNKFKKQLVLKVFIFIIALIQTEKGILWFILFILFYMTSWTEKT